MATIYMSQPDLGTSREELYINVATIKSQTALFTTVFRPQFNGRKFRTVTIFETL